MSGFNITATLDRVLSQSDDTTVSEATYSRLVAYVRGQDVKVAHLAYVIRARGVDGSSGNAALQRLAADIDRSRSALAQWASAYAFLVEGNIVRTAETFASARRAYNSTAEGRAHVAATLPTIAAADADERPAMLASLADAVAAWKRDAKPLPADAVAPTGDAPTGDATTSDTRTARMASDDVATRTGAWIAALESLADAAGDDDTSNIALTDAQAAHVVAVLDVIRARTVGALVNA